jgi:hypothetical protein
MYSEYQVDRLFELDSQLDNIELMVQGKVIKAATTQGWASGLGKLNVKALKAQVGKIKRKNLAKHGKKHWKKYAAGTAAGAGAVGGAYGVGKRRANSEKAD